MIHVPPVALWQHAAALALVIADIVARGARSTALIPVTLLRAMMVNSCGDAVAAITPSRAGGDPVRFVWFKRGGIPAPIVIASFATENVINGVVLVIGAVALVAHYASATGRIGMGWIGASAASNTKLVLVGLAVVVVTTATIQAAPRLRTSLLAFLRDSWRAFRAQSRGAVAWATLHTIVSMVARLAILPVLMAQTPGVGLGGLVLVSVLALYSLLLAPTPGGIGLVEAGFFAGFASTLNTSEIASLLVAWRVYAWACSAVVGAALLLHHRIQTRAV